MFSSDCDFFFVQWYFLNAVTCFWDSLGAIWQSGESWPSVARCSMLGQASSGGIWRSLLIHQNVYIKLKREVLFICFLIICLFSEYFIGYVDFSAFCDYFLTLFG